MQIFRPSAVSVRLKYSLVLVIMASLILFANPRAGGTLAKEYLQLPDGQTSFTVEGRTVKVLVFDLLDAASKKTGLQAVRGAVNDTAEVRVLVAGGDGSLIWLLQDLVLEGVPLDRVAVSPLPFGTGNDLAATLGWGRKPSTPLLGANLELAVQDWVRAEPEAFDVWEVDLQLREGGYFTQVVRELKSFRKTVLQDEGLVKTRLTRLMSNYFSLGVDARIGLGFDKARTRSQVRNKMVYAWEGFKKLCCLPVTDLKDFLYSFEDLDPAAPKLIYDAESLPLPDTFVTIIAQNVTTYAASDHQLWANAYSNVGQLDPQHQRSNDGLLEFLTFPAGFGIALEQVPMMRGNARRLHQGRGPFYLRTGGRTVYLNIDGEYYAAQGLESVSLRLWPQSHQVRVLRKPSYR